jgi:[ribosomal protein S18]-alanine N-acetyltransferase
VENNLTAASAELGQVAIAPAGWRDWRGVLALEHACFQLDAWGPVELFFALVGRNVRYKAVSGQRLVGFVMSDPQTSQGFSWIATIGVHPDFQRRGIGQRLLAAAEADIATARIRLTVRRSNLGAIALYQKFGYQQTSVWEHYYAGGEAGIVMEKQKR